MNFKELILTINKKKQNYEDYYKDLLLLENELRNCESIVKAQVHYFLGVDFLFYQDNQKALEHQYSALELLINLVYTTRDIEIIHSTIQKVIIEISKIESRDVIRAFYGKSKSVLTEKNDNWDIQESKGGKENIDSKGLKVGRFIKNQQDNKPTINQQKSESPYICTPDCTDNKSNNIPTRLKKLIRNFQDIKRVFTEHNDIFIFLLKEDPKASLDFLTSDHQIDLLIEKMKTECDFEIINNLRHKQKTNKLLVFLLIHDTEYFEEYLSQLKALVIRTGQSNILIELMTSCLSTGKINIHKRIFHEISSLLSEEDKRTIQVFITDIYKVFSDDFPRDYKPEVESLSANLSRDDKPNANLVSNDPIHNELIDLEQVVHYWFITKQYSKILKNGDRVSKKVLFIASSRENNTNSMIENESLSSSSDDLDKIGANWNVENDYILEKVRCCLRNMNYKESNAETGKAMNNQGEYNTGDSSQHNINYKNNHLTFNHEKIKAITRKVKDVNLLISILKLIKNCEYTLNNQEGVDEDFYMNKNEEVDVVPHLRPLLKEILLECLNKKGLLFQGLKVFVSFLHLRALDFGVYDRLRLLNGLKYEGLSEADKLWLYKVVYNNLVDLYEGVSMKEVLRSL